MHTEVLHQHFMLYKPYGYLSQFVCEHKNKKLLGELYPFPEGTMSIGRLDEDSEGLLLLTTDGKTSEWVRSKNIEKEYYAQVDGIITQDAIQQLCSGLNISIQGINYQTLPCKAFVIEIVPEFPERGRRIRSERHGPTSWISITLTEGKYRQIRKMTAAVGFPTLRLIRVRIGNIHLQRMQPGEVKTLDSISELI